MENQLPIIILILLCFGVVIFFLNKKISELKSSKDDSALLEWLKTMQESVRLSSSDMTRVLQENSKQLNIRVLYFFKP